MTFTVGRGVTPWAGRGEKSHFHQHFSGHHTAIGWETADARFVLFPELAS